MKKISIRAQERLSRILANVLLVALVLYLAVELAKVTWLFAWDDRPVPELFGQVSAAADAVTVFRGLQLLVTNFSGDQKARSAWPRWCVDQHRQPDCA